MSSSPPSLWYSISASLAAGALRACVATPLDAVATREILHHITTLQTVREMKFYDYWRGFQPNFFKFTTRTPAQFLFIKVSSTAVPTNLDPAIRGAAMGILTSGMETFIMNSFNSIRTRLIQGNGWHILYKEGPHVLTRGLGPAFIHRAISWGVFMGTYEKLKEKFPTHTFAISTFSGFSQVITTAPFYITAIHKQQKGAIPERLDKTFLRIIKTQGFARGLFLPALAPRLIQSAITSAPLLWLMEKLQLIHR